MKKGSSRSIAILSDHTLFRQGLTELLHQQGYPSVTDYATSRDLLASARLHPPNILMVDLDHEQADTMTLVRLLRNELPQTHLVVLGSAPRQEAIGAVRADSQIETPHASATALAAVATCVRDTPAAGRREARRLWAVVTPRQRDVLRWLATGIDNQAIAHRLHIGQRAVKAHLSALLDTFGVLNRTQLALIADHAGLKPPRSRAARV